MTPHGYVQQNGMHIVYITVWVDSTVSLCSLCHHRWRVAGCADTEEDINTVRNMKLFCLLLNWVNVPDMFLQDIMNASNKQQ